MGLGEIRQRIADLQPGELMQAGAHMVKLEGGGWTAEIVRFLVERG